MIPLESITSGSLAGGGPRAQPVAFSAPLCYVLTDVFNMVATVAVITLHRMRHRSLIAFPVPLARAHSEEVAGASKEAFIFCFNSL